MEDRKAKLEKEYALLQKQIEEIEAIKASLLEEIITISLGGQANE